MNAEGCCCFVGVNVVLSVIVAVMPMYMSEKNVGDMSEICRKEKLLKTNMLSFYEELLPTINVGDFVGNHVGDIKGGKKKFGGNAKSGYSKA